MRCFGRAPARVVAFLAQDGVRAAVFDVVHAEARVADGCVTLVVIGALGSELALDELVRRTRGLAQRLEEAVRRGALPGRL